MGDEDTRTRENALYMIAEAAEIVVGLARNFRRASIEVRELRAENARLRGELAGRAKRK